MSASSLSALVPPTSPEFPSLGNACASSVSEHDSGLVCNPGVVSSVCIDGCVVHSMSQARVCKLSPEKSTLC